MPPTDVDADDPPSVGADRRGLSWPRVTAVVLVALFFGASVGYVVGIGRPPGDDSVDVGFYRDMIAHHEQAIEMALIELSNGENDVVRSFAQEIVLFQSWEMGRMHEQLVVWNVSTVAQDTAMAWMGMEVPSDQMPGLATEEQLAALRATEAEGADALFLDLMAEHHRAGAEMAAVAAREADDPGVRDLAASMARNQGLEIAEYRQTAARFGFDIDIQPYDPDAAHMG